MKLPPLSPHIGGEADGWPAVIPWGSECRMTVRTSAILAHAAPKVDELLGLLQDVPLPGLFIFGGYSNACHHRCQSRPLRWRANHAVDAEC